eukprot:jgi/Chrzof1/5850/Cz16g18030.t1
MVHVAYLVFNSILFMLLFCTWQVAPHLRQLLLPSRLVAAGSSHLAALGSLSHLSHLRIGWKAGSHEGPTGFGDGSSSNSSSSSSSAGNRFGPCLSALVSPAVCNVNQTQQQQRDHLHTSAPPASTGLPDAWVLADAAHQAAAAGPALAHDAYLLATPACEATAAGLGLTQAANATASGLSAQDQAGGVHSHPPSWSTHPSSLPSAAVTSPPHFPSLRCLEITGPMHPCEFSHLFNLSPGLTSLKVSSNPSWSTGLPVDDLVRLATLPGLRQLRVADCTGLQGDEVENKLRHAGPGSEWVDIDVEAVPAAKESGAGDSPSTFGLGAQQLLGLHQHAVQQHNHPQHNFAGWPGINAEPGFGNPGFPMNVFGGQEMAAAQVVNLFGGDWIVGNHQPPLPAQLPAPAPPHYQAPPPHYSQAQELQPEAMQMEEDAAVDAAGVEVPLDWVIEGLDEQEEHQGLHQGNMAWVD